MKKFITISLIIVLEAFIVNAQIDDVKSFIDNGNFEIADGWGIIGDIVAPANSCFNEIIKYWYGCATADVYSRNIPDSVYPVHYRIPDLTSYPVDYNPNTWDKDINNNYYLYMSLVT